MDPTAAPSPRQSAVGRAVFAAAVFLSAFLLFQVQPLVSKQILPWFGGSPGVWTACLLLFQLLLLAGYVYAHLVATRLPLRVQTIVHLGVILVAALTLDILPDAAAADAETSPEREILALLGGHVALPFLVLSTTGPLLQRWQSLVDPSQSPYRLYAVSNAGSLLALVSYPFAFEPLLSLPHQARLWSAAFVVFVVLCGACARAAYRMHSTPQATQTGGRPRLSRLAMWTGLAFVPSLMLLATTNALCQDVAVVPFLWVIPLAVYLASFVLCFDSDRWYRRTPAALATALGVAGIVAVEFFGSRVSLSLQSGALLFLLASLCMLGHGELARLRPAPEHLTAYYLAVAAGGAAGGLFVAIAAPALFDDFWELELGALAGVLIATWVAVDAVSHSRLAPLASLALAVLLITALGTILTESILAAQNAIHASRNFYGTLRVEHDVVVDAVVLRHGRIIHGLQLDANPGYPTTYYTPGSGVGRVIRELQQDRQSLHIGLVGLGAGTLSAYARPEDSLRYYEINPGVERMARAHFTFLDNCAGDVEVVIGDARLLLDREQPQSFDLLVLDAFSGDAIPTHLLTMSAMSVYERHLKPDGVIALHITNLHFDLRPVADALAEAHGFTSATLQTVGGGAPVDPGCDWVLMARDPELLTRPALADVALPPQPHRVRWTDEFTNLLSVLKE